MKIKVLHVIKSLGRGGAEMLLPETLAVHDKEKFEFHYIYFLPWKNQVVGEIESNGGIVHCIPAKNNMGIIFSANNIADYVRKNSIQVIHAHLPWAGIVCRLAGKLSNIPVIYTEHNKWERYHQLTFLLNKLTFPWQRQVIAVSNDVAESIKKFHKKKAPKISVILNGVNTEKFKRNRFFDTDIRAELNIGEAIKVIGIISVFRVQKRLITWLEIAKEIHDRNPETYFIIVGDGPLKQDIYSKADELGMMSYLHFAGLQTEVRPYLKSMDIFMMCSEFEGLPVALLEAMSMECIPACTAAGGIPEVLDDDIDGIVVPVDKPRDLLNRINYLIKNWHLADNFKAAAREKVKKEYSIIRMVAELEKFYLNISKR